MRRPAERAGVVLRHVRVVDDGVVERLERVDRLLEHLDHGNAAHVFSAGLVHTHERAHIGFHELAALAAHHGRHGGEGHHHGNEAGRAQAPVEGNEKHKQARHHGHGTRDVGEHVCEQGFGRCGAAVHDAAQLAGGVRVEVAERQLEQVLACGLADVGRAAKRRQMRAHKTGEVDHNACQGKAHCPPPVRCDARSIAPVGGHGDEISSHEPDAHVGTEAQKLRHRREPHPQIREEPAIAGVCKQLADAAALFFSSHADSFPVA